MKVKRHPGQVRSIIKDFKQAQREYIDAKARLEMLAHRVRKVCEEYGQPLPRELQRNPAGRAGAGLTADIRELFARGDVFTAPEVHDGLVTAGQLDANKYRNSQSVIHNTLRRMVKQGELVTTTVAGSHKTAYRKTGT